MNKTLIISLEFPPKIGGIASYVSQFSLSLPPGDVMVLAPPHPKAREWDAKQPYNIFRKRFYFPIFIWPRWLLLYWHVRRIVRQYQVDIIHLHHVLPVGYVAGRIKKKFGIKYLVFSHGTDIASAGAKKWKRKMMIAVSKQSEQIIVNSQNLRRRLVNVFPELADMTSVLYPCPDKEYLTPPPKQVIDSLVHQYALEGKKVLLSVSRLDDGKGFPHLIRLMPKILQRVPQLVWFIIGDGDKRDVIVKEIQKQNLQNIVRFIGEIPHEDLLSYYHLADVFVLLTHPDNGKEEGLGLVFLEAAAAGLPVVAGRSGGVEEAVLHEKTGLVIDIHQHPNDIVDAIVKTMTDQSYAQALGRAGQDRIQREFVWKEQLKVISKWM
jgi:phosphatidyl-myo-inositol dimannoside synthase